MDMILKKRKRQLKYSTIGSAIVEQQPVRNGRLFLWKEGDKLSFTILEAKQLAESWFTNLFIDEVNSLVWGNEFIRHSVDSKSWPEATKYYPRTKSPDEEPTVAASGSGSITGDYYVMVTFVDENEAEGNPCGGSTVITASSDAQFDWSDIPTLTGYDRKLYRTKADDDSIYYYVATIADDTTTTYTDTVTDSNLTIPMFVQARYDLPTGFYRLISVQNLSKIPYYDYSIGNGKISFPTDDDYVMTYVPYPTALTAITGTGQNVPLHDDFKYPLAEFLVYKHFNPTNKDLAAEYEKRYVMNLRGIYGEMDVNSSTTFKPRMRWS